MIGKIVNSKLIQLCAFALLVFIFAFFLFSLNSDPIIKFANNNFHVNTNTGNVTAPNGSYRECLFVTQIRQSAAPLKFEYKFTTLVFVGNLLVELRSESDWIEVPLTP